MVCVACVTATIVLRLQRRLHVLCGARHDLPHCATQMTKQLEDEKAKLIERKRQEQEERQRKQLELEKILEDNRRLVSACLPSCCSSATSESVSLRSGTH